MPTATAGQTLVEVLAASAERAGAISSAQRVAGTLRGAILSGEARRGMVVTESAIATSLAVSRNTAREALRLLAGEGLLKQQPHHSYVVALLSDEDVDDLFAVRTVLEHSAAQVLASRDDVDWGPLERSVDRFRWLVESNDDLEILEADRQFHVALIEGVGSHRLSMLYGRLEGEIRLCLSISTRAHSNVHELVDQHAELLELLQSGRAKDFQRALTQHLAVAHDRVRQALAAAREADDG